MGSMRILVVDDDRAVRDALRRALTLAGYEVQMAEGGQQALTQVATGLPDAVVLDVGMPDIDGLDAGADDYLVKPFDVGELKARLRALMRRSNGEGDPDALSFAELKLDSARHGVIVDDRFAELTRTEYQLLELLMLNPRRVLPHGLIYDRVWGYDFGPASNALRVYVGYLRRKLEDAGARQLIHTIRGVGYVLREP
jgi:two-component system response regulator MprA